MKKRLEYNIKVNLGIVILVLVMFIVLYLAINQRIINIEETRIPVKTTSIQEGTVVYTPNKSSTLTFVSGEYPPYIYTEDGVIKGSDYDIICTVLNAMGVDYTIEMVSWERGLYMLDSGEAFGTFPYIKSEERLKRYLFSNPLVNNGIQLEYFFGFTGEGRNKIVLNREADLEKYRIGLIYGYYYMEDMVAKGYNVDLSSTEKECIQKLIDGKVDLVLFDRRVMDYYSHEVFKLYDHQFYNTQLLFQDHPVSDHLIINKQNEKGEAFMSEFNEKMAELFATGAISR